MSSGFPTRFDSNRAVQPQKMARGLKFQILDVEGLFYLVEKALISCMVTVTLICAFVFTYAHIDLPTEQGKPTTVL